MSSEKVTEKKTKGLEPGMYECEMLQGSSKGETLIYHSSTAETLEKKKFLKVIKKVKVYIPKTMKK